MTSNRMQEFISGLKSRDEEIRVRTAYSLQRYVSTELREESGDVLIKFINEFNSQIFHMVTSKDADEKKGGIYAIICLMDLDEGQKTHSISRSYNMLTNLITTYVSGVSELAVKALGRLLLVSGPPTVSSIELLLIQCFNFIEGSDDNKKKLSILLCKELCMSVPSQFYQHILRFFELILTHGIWDADATIREESVAAITVALSVSISREAKEPSQPPWYSSCLRDVLFGLEDSSSRADGVLSRNISREERLHVTFLLLNELLKYANAAWEARAASLRHMTHYHTTPKKEGVMSMMRRIRGNSTTSSSTCSSTGVGNNCGTACSSSYAVGLPTSHSLDQLVIASQPQNEQQQAMGGGIECERPIESGILRALLQKNYTKLCTLLTTFKTNRNSMVQASLLKLLPRLAAFRPSEFTSNGYLEQYIHLCLNIARAGRDKEKSMAFVCTGLLTIACKPATLIYIPKILETIKATLPTKESMTRKRGPHTVEPSVLVCLSLVAHSLGPGARIEELLAVDQFLPPPSPARAENMDGKINEAQDAIEELLGTILASGLSPTLALCMQELAAVLPGLKSYISDGLLKMLAGILIQRGTTSPSSGSSSSATADVQHVPTIVLALRTLSNFDFEDTAGPWLLQVVREISDRYLGHKNKEVRLEAVVTVCHLLQPVCLKNTAGLPQHNHQTLCNTVWNDHTTQHPLHATVIYEHVSKVLWISVTDTESDVRLCALACAGMDCFSVHLAQPENLNALILSLNDEVQEIRETSAAHLAKLSSMNPAYVHPLLRKTLLKVLGELDFTGIGRNREMSARMLRHMIAHAPRFLRQLVQPIMSVVVPILTQPDINPVVTVSLMTAVGDLAQVSGGDIQPWVPTVFQILLKMLESGLCGWRRQVALVTIGQLVESSGGGTMHPYSQSSGGGTTYPYSQSSGGGTMHPYSQYPFLLQLLLSILKTETQPAVRRETLRLLGLLGAIDPYKHKMNVGAITIQRDTGVAVIDIEDQEETSQGTLVLETTGPSEMLVNQGFAAIEEYYAACAIAAMLRMLRDSSLAQYHNNVLLVINFIYQNLGAKGVTFLNLVVPSMLQVVRSCDQSNRDTFLTRLASFIAIVGQHIRNYVEDIVQVIKQFWVPDVSTELVQPLIKVVESVAVAMGAEFRVHLKDMMPLILKSLMSDGKEKVITKMLLDAFAEFGVNLEEFLHVLLPHITCLFDDPEVPLKVRSASITTVQSLCVDIHMGDFLSKIMHPLLRTLGQWPELKTQCMELLTTLIATLESAFICFIPVTNDVLTQCKINDQIYDLLVAKVIKGYPISEEERVAAQFGRGAKKPNQSFYDLTNSADKGNNLSSSKRSLWSNLEKARDVNRLTSKEDWTQWLLGLGMNLLRGSPNVALRAVYRVSVEYPQVARDLFNVSFMAAWSDIDENMQDEFLASLNSALRSQQIPEITQALLNLTEFMDHSDKGGLPVEASLLGMKAMECRAYAKALHYLEEQFYKSPSTDVLQNLISINNKLGQKEAATGLLEYAHKHNSTAIQVEESWFEKVHDWEQASRLYEEKLSSHPDDFNLALGKMRCMEALGEWGELYKTTRAWWDLTPTSDIDGSSSRNESNKSQIARLTVAASWAADEWSMMERALVHVPPDSHNGAFYRAILAVHQGNFDRAHHLINFCRTLHDDELTAMASESYERAYSSIVTMQTLAELEEAIQYTLVAERRPVIRNIWYQRLQSNQRVVDDWHKILLVRSLVLKPQEDMRPWLEFASMCRKNNRHYLAKKTLITLLGNDPEATDDLSLPNVNPNAGYEYAKFLHTQPGREMEAFTLLQNFVTQLQSISMPKPQQDALRVLISKIYLKIGEWHEQIYGVSELTLPTITSYNNNAVSSSENCYKAWHAFAYSNFQALLIQEEKLQSVRQKLREEREAARLKEKAPGAVAGGASPYDSDNGENERIHTLTITARQLEEWACDYAVEAAKGFIRSIEVGGSSNSVQDCLRLLTVWFSHGHKTPLDKVLSAGLKSIRVDTWLQVIPQLIARIDTPRQFVRQLVHDVISDIGKQHPQALLYPLTVAAKSSDRCRSSAAESLLTKMKEHSRTLVQQAALVSEELIRVSILRHERWHEALEEACKLYFGERNEQAMLRTLLPLHTIMDKEPETLNEVAFNQAYGRDLTEAKDWCLRYQCTKNVRDLDRAWELYYNVFRRISRQLTLTTLELHSVSPRLLACRDLEIAVPGSYTPNSPLICISYVHPSLQVLSTKQKPRKLCIRSTTGHDIMFLLKGHEDLRQDERVMQLFGLVNTFLINNPETFRRNLTVQRYAVVPLSTNSGLIKWLPHCDTLHVLIKDWRDKKKILLTIESKIMMRMAPALDRLTVMQKTEVFEHALNVTNGDDLAKLLWLKSPSSEVWFDRRTNFTRSLAVMSMIGYVLGLGDRHPSNLLLDQKSGKIIHIDFGDCFEVAMTREKFPEKIPFRLTRMLINAMEVTGIDGTYRMTCESVMTILRRNKDSVMAMLEAFIYDPLLTWRLVEQQPAAQPGGGPATGAAVAAGIADASQSNNNDDDVPTLDNPEILNKKAVAIVNRVKDKLTGRDFPNCRDILDVPSQVDLLIKQATNHENLSQCYIGWCPFW